MLTLENAANKQLQECIDSTTDNYRSSVRAIIASEDGSDPKHIGSCFLLNIDGKRLVVTAAHIIDWIDTHSLSVVGTVGTKPVPIEGEVTSTEIPEGGREEDKLDFAFWEIPEASILGMGVVDFIEVNSVSHNRVEPAGRSYCVMGYPRSKNKKNVDNARRTIKTTVTSYTGTGIGAAEIDADQSLSSHRNLVFQHGQRSMNFDGEEVNSFSPRGLSGGPILDLGAFSSISTYEIDRLKVGKLCGMLIERDEDQEQLIGVKIQQIIAGVREKYAV